MKFVTSNLRVQEFRDLEMPAELMAALSRMKISKPTEIQAQAIPAAISGQDVIGVAQTGSGKTLAYALTVLIQLHKKPESRALVLAPSREMAQQIHKVFEQLCQEMPVSCCLAIGGATGSKQSSELKKKPRMIIATPGRMNDHLLTNKLLLQGVDFLVIDEADRMLDMGFAPQLKAIENTLRGQWQTLMFSASFGQKVESVADLFMNEEVLMVRTADAEAPVETLSQKVFFMNSSQKNKVLLEELTKIKGQVIVFAGLQGSCHAVASLLENNGFESAEINGAMTQGHRNKVIRQFHDGEIRIVVATDLLARGIDVPSVACVINYELPYQSEDFLHRIGRTARAGRSGKAYTFITPSDYKDYRKIKKYLEDAEDIYLDVKFKFIEPPKRASFSDRGPVEAAHPAAEVKGDRGDRPKSEAASRVHLRTERSERSESSQQKSSMAKPSGPRTGRTEVIAKTYEKRTPGASGFGKPAAKKGGSPSKGPNRGQEFVPFEKTSPVGMLKGIYGGAAGKARPKPTQKRK